MKRMQAANSKELLDKLELMLTHVTPGEYVSKQCEIAIRITQRRRTRLFYPAACSYEDAALIVLVHNNLRTLLRLARAGEMAASDTLPSNMKE